MAEISKSCGELLDILKTRGVNRDSCIGIILTIKEYSYPKNLADSNYKKLLKWIKANSSAEQVEIIQQMKKVLDLVPYYDVPKDFFLLFQNCSVKFQSIFLC